MKLVKRRAELGDLPALKRLTDEYLAPEYYSLETLEAYVRAENGLFFVVTDADRDGAVVAYFYAFLATLDEALGVLHVQEKPGPLTPCDGEALVGVYKTVSTEREYQNCGICSSLVRDLMPVLQERGAKLILVPAMRSPAGEVPAGAVLRDSGFVPIAETYRPWEDLDLYCPHCGRHHCVCDAVIYMKELDETEGEDVDE